MRHSCNHIFTMELAVVKLFLLAGMSSVNFVNVAFSE